MSISSIGSASSVSAAGVSPFQQRRQDFQQLQQALANGDLSGAQSAFSALQQLFQAAGAGAATATGTGTSPAAVAATATSGSSTGSATASPLASDWTALGQALSSGNLQGAQSAFAQLQTDFRAALQSVADGSSSGTLNVRGASASANGAVHHGHHHHHAGGSAASGTVGAGSSTSNSTNADGDSDGSTPGSVLSSNGSSVTTTTGAGSLLNVSA